MTNRNNSWQTNVDELVRLLRRALLALIPIVEAARIPWKEGEAYDQWDAIANVLFDKLIVEPLAWGLGAVDKFRLAAYDLVVDDYRDVSFLSVNHPSLPPDWLIAFLRFATQDEALDTVEVAVLDSTLRATGRVDRLPVSEVRFHLHRLEEGGERGVVAEIVVPE